MVKFNNSLFFLFVFFALCLSPLNPCLAADSGGAVRHVAVSGQAAYGKVNIPDFGVPGNQANGGRVDLANSGASNKSGPGWMLRHYRLWAGIWSGKARVFSF